MASLSNLLCLLVIVGTAIMAAESRGINNGWISPGNGLRYRVTPSKLSWHAAKHWCASIGGSLATSGMKDYWTRVAVANVMILRDEFTWIGLNDLRHEGKWMWLDGQYAHGNAHWHKGEPNNSRGREDCAGINLGRNFRSNDGNCDHKHHGLCESTLH